MTGTLVSSSPCTISTGVRIFDANEIGLTWSWGCGPAPSQPQQPLSSASRVPPSPVATSIPQSLTPAAIMAALNRPVCPIAQAVMNPPVLPYPQGGNNPAGAGPADAKPVRVRDPLGNQQVDPAGDVAPFAAA